MIRNVHRCVSKGAEKSAFYVCLFLPNVEVIYCSKANEYQFMRCSQPYCVLEQPNSCDWRHGCISPQGKMMRKECLHNILRLSMMDSTSWHMSYSLLVLNTLHEMKLKSFRIYKHFRNDVMHQCFTEENGDWPSKREKCLAFYIISEQFQLCSK